MRGMRPEPPPAPASDRPQETRDDAAAPAPDPPATAGRVGPASGRRSLWSGILAWLGVYGLLLTAGVFLHGYFVNEFAERLVWDSLLKTEMSHYLNRSAHDPGYRWTDTDSLKLYVEGERPPPAELASLPEGIHDEMVLDGREILVLVQRIDGRNHVMVLDITELEQQEDRLMLFVLGSALAVAALMGAIIAWGLRRALEPLTGMAQAISQLSPQRGGQRIALDPRASAELVVTAGALNDYLARNERFVDRERAFIDSASHELRTPIAVIMGATELALNQPGLPEAARGQVRRAHRAAREVEQLIALLLVLAREPSRLAHITDDVALDELVRELVDDHRYLCQGRDLQLRLDVSQACRISAPIGIVQAAIGNLLRNAIENSDQGDIAVTLAADGTVTIADPGRGMDPEQISRIYAEQARGGGRRSGGIGLDLVGRLCRHLGWQLAIESTPGLGTVSTLRFGPPGDRAPD